MGTSSIGGMNVVLSANAASFSAGIAQAQAQLNKFAAASKATGHASVSSSQAAAAAIRVVEGNMTNNIRAAEKFISTIPGVGRALQVAFPLVGAFAFAGVLSGLIKGVAEFVDNTLKMPQKLDNAWRELNLAGLAANDTLAITNDHLASEIAKLQGKPENNLKLAIDEARLAADKLAESLDRDNSRVAELLKSNHISVLGGLLGRGGTAYVEGSINSYNQKFADLGAQRNTAVHAGDSAGVARLDKALKDAEDSALNYVADQIKRRRAGEGFGNQDANIADLQGFGTVIHERQDQQSLEATHVQREAQKEKLEAEKALAEQRKKFAAEARAAQEAIVAQWRKDLDTARADNTMTIAQEGQFWVQRVETARKGSLSYLAALDETNKAIAHMRQQNGREQKEFDKTAGESYAADRFDLSRGANFSEQGRQGVDLVRNLAEGITLQKQNTSAQAEAAIQMAVTVGQMSRLDAAQAQAALHARAYTQMVDDLHQALAAVANDPSLTATERAAAAAGLNNQLAQVGGQRALQVQQDQQGVAVNQIGPAMRQAVDRMVSDWKDMAGRISEVLGRTIDGLNDNIVLAMTGKKTNFGEVFTQAGQGLLKTGLQKAESLVLGKLGLGKADGSSEGAALWVRMASGVASVGGLASTALGGLGKWIRPFFQGHFAAGGDVLGGYPAMVGERGPEMFVPRSAGSIVPNHMLGGTTHYYAVDARGANDPAAIHAAVARALPHAVAASVQAQHQMSKRTPQGR